MPNLLPSSLKILDFTRLLPGPKLTSLLSSLGATVTKIESPIRPDTTQSQHPGLYYQLNHDKELRIVDYNTDEGREEILELARESDVIVEGFRPGIMASWGFGYPAIKELNSSIIYASITGYGQTSIYADAAGHDINYLARSGLLAQNMSRSPSPVPSVPAVPGFQTADVAGGSYVGAMAILAAIIKRDSSPNPKPVHLDIDMTAGVSSLATVPFSISQTGLNDDTFNVLNGRTAVNYAVYGTKDGKFLAVGALEMKFWRRVCDVIDKPAWKKMNQLQLLINPPAGRGFPVGELEDIFRSKTRGEWDVIFDAADCCVTGVLELNEIAKHPYHVGRGSFEDVEGADLGMVKSVGMKIIGADKVYAPPFTVIE